MKERDKNDLTKDYSVKPSLKRMLHSLEASMGLIYIVCSSPSTTYLLQLSGLKRASCMQLHESVFRYFSYLLGCLGLMRWVQDGLCTSPLLSLDVVSQIEGNRDKNSPIWWAKTRNDFQNACCLRSTRTSIVFVSLCQFLIKSCVFS